MLALLFGYPIPLVMAVLISERAASEGSYSALAYLPVVIPPVVGVLLWKYVFYEPSSVGLFNTILGWVHLGPYGWLQSPGTAMPALVVEATWANAGTTVIIYLAALLIVDPDLYDAASVDGAGLWRKIWHITLPQLRGVLLVTLMLQIIATAQGSSSRSSSRRAARRTRRSPCYCSSTSTRSVTPSASASDRRLR